MPDELAPKHASTTDEPCIPEAVWYRAGCGGVSSGKALCGLLNNHNQDQSYQPSSEQYDLRLLSLIEL